MSSFMNDKDTLLDEFSILLKKKALEMGKEFVEYFNEFKTSLDELGGWKGLFEYARNVEEKVVDTFSFEDCIKWIKSYLNPQIHGGAIIFRKKNDAKSEKKLTLKVCYMGKDGQPLSDNESKHLIVRCDSVSDDLANAFGDKDMIVVK